MVDFPTDSIWRSRHDDRLEVSELGELHVNRSTSRLIIISACIFGETRVIWIDATQTWLTPQHRKIVTYFFAKLKKTYLVACRCP